MKKNRKFYCNLIFCNSPLEHIYSFKDLFQICPLPEEYKINFDRQTHFPLLLEYSVNQDNKPKVKHPDLIDSEDMIAEMTLQNNRLNLILKLLSTFTNHYFFTYEVDQGWFIPMPQFTNLSKEEYNNIESSWGFKYYIKQGLKERLQIAEFTALDGNKMVLEKHPEYYQRPKIDEEIPITFSEHTDLMFHAFELLNPSERKYFDSAITLIYNGQQIRNRMKSLAYISFISSIETMTAYEFRSKQKEIEFECNSCKLIKKSPFICKDCGNPIWGISQQFKAYLSKYLTSDPKSNAVINKIYSIRSKIVHSGQLLLGDAFMKWDENEKQNEEFESLISVMQYSKLSIVNWLIQAGKEKQQLTSVLQKRD